MEEDMKPKQVPLYLRWHICEKCACEVDTHSDNSIHFEGDYEKYQHRDCPTLKSSRP